MERIDPQGDKDHVTHEWVACNWLFLFFGRVSTVGVLLIWCVESNHLWIHVYTTYYNGMISRLILYLMSFLFIVSYAYSYYIYELLYTKCHYQVATKQYQRYLRWWIEEEQTASEETTPSRLQQQCLQPRCERRIFEIIIVYIHIRCERAWGIYREYWWGEE